MLFLAGAIGSVWAVAQWALSGFGAIYGGGLMRVLVLSLTAITVAIQAAAAGFLASVFALRR